MIDSTAIQQRADDRARIAQAMDDYERRNGPVKTLAIICGTDKRIPFAISNPDKPKQAKPVKTRSAMLNELDGKRTLVNSVKKARSQQKIEKIKAMAARGAKIAEMAEAVGMAPGSVHRLMRENSIKRGPQTNLEA